MFRLGIIINPLAGIGGRVALKGSDGPETQQLAQQRGAVPMAQQRMRQALELLHSFKDSVHIYTASHDMGESVCQSLDLDYTVINPLASSSTHPDDTEQTVQKCLEAGVDLLIFAGGDGTARNIYRVLSENKTYRTPPVIGVPAGCKIHSSVYAVTPKHAGELLSLLIKGRPLSLTEASVMDIDEEAFRKDVVKARLFGYLMVPAENQFMQNMKQGGITHESLTLQDIASYLIETMQEDCVYLIGSGSTPKAILDELDLPATLLGVDAVLNQQLLAADLTEQQIIEILDNHSECKLILTLIGGQGHVFGRGNQQLSPDVIKRIGMKNIQLISTPEKLHALDGQPMRVDTGDEALDQSLYGMVSVITGYEETTLYRIA